VLLRGGGEEIIMLRLQITSGPMKGKSLALDGATLFIGRSSRNDFQIKDSTISRKQIKLFFIGKKLFLEDLKSTNGTWLNDKLIPPGEGFEVGSGDSISLGNTVIRLDDSASAPPLKKNAFISPHPTGMGFGKGIPEEERRKKSSGDLEALHALSTLIRSASGLQEMLGSLLERLLRILPRIDRAAIILFDEGKKEKTDVVSRSKTGAENSKTGFSDVVIDRVIGEGKAVRMSNTNFEEPSDISENDSTLEIGSLLCVPLLSHEKTHGVLYVDSLTGPYGFRKDDLLFLNAISGPLALAIENERLRQR
jgi:phosphoserine phosphatase RsbU/P